MTLFQITLWFASEKDEAEVAIEFADAVDWQSLGTDAGSYAVEILPTWGELGGEESPDVSGVEEAH